MGGCFTEPEEADAGRGAGFKAAEAGGGLTPPGAEAGDGDGGRDRLSGACETAGGVAAGAGRGDGPGEGARFACQTGGFEEDRGAVYRPDEELERLAVARGAVVGGGGSAAADICCLREGAVVCVTAADAM